jgi:hypothetical protein
MKHVIRQRDENGCGHRQRGQGLVEFALVVPIVILLVVSVAELGLAFGDAQTIGYGSREGARAGSALARGGVRDCSSGDDPAGVDAAIVSAVQRILKSPGSGIDISKVTDIRIFRASSSGAEISGTTNVWRYVGEQQGVEVDPGPGFTAIDFAPASVAWPACVRDNGGASPDSIGVTVNYRYDFRTPVPSVIDAIAGGGLSLPLRETTVMSLNPSL